ncbi:hypothetical protein Q8W71_10365 [Methylobacterium sp. NEAU 140]|uniref:hypothetical protein n=1 Tax=Methylobacterium sp. NEAU 140 TaxID=3064945 RepID=UPI00273344C5|nr:hypothetical protein [Methylobacterium sp. NEAU 140]MDP4023028.1 hypothetical protein [Methylobacterium sp. NEAU 140]
MVRSLLAAATLVLLEAAPALAQQFTLPPGYSNSVANSGIPGIENGHVFLYNAPPAWDPAQTLRVERRIGTGSGNPGWTYNALYATCTTNAQNKGYEWCGTFESHNTAHLSTGAQNVALNATMWRDPTDTGEPTSPSWAGNFNCVDTVGKPDPVSACVGAEINVGGAVGTDANRQRVAVHAAVGGQPGSHVGYGYMVSGTPGVTVDRAFSTANVGALFGIGLDLAGGVFSGAAVLLAPGQSLALDGTPDGGFGRFLFYRDGALTYMTPGGAMLRLGDDGAVRLGRVIEEVPHVPASATAPCTAGERAWDERFEYRCVAPNRWKRAALSDW